MSAKRFELALEKLEGSQWERFERFASAFLSAEFPQLRTVASPSGDDGRDAELFSPDADVTQVLQYSVATDWKTKIRKTAGRLVETLPETEVLIYVTNQRIGADADELKREIRKNVGFVVDIRDRSYFLERQYRSAQTEAVSEELATDVVNPFLAQKGVLPRSAAAMNADETKAAHVYLSLQFRDDAQEKGLTKLSFEALVRAVLMNTNSENRMARTEVKRRVKQLLPNDDAVRIESLVDGALARLTRRSLRFWGKADEFCLTHEEVQRLSEFIAAHELSEIELVRETTAVALSFVPENRSLSNPDGTAARIQQILERCLFSRSEDFASAVYTGNTATFDKEHLSKVVAENFKNHPANKGDIEGEQEWLAGVIREILANPGEETQKYLRELADAYTLMGFLRQTPDVQSAVEKMFSHGEIWLDTSAILPLFAEELLDDGEGQFRRMLTLAGQAGISLFVTGGVIEELERHINNSVVCSRKAGEWQGRYPFLFEAFLRSGRSYAEFAAWTEIFKGSDRPLDDIADFLAQRFAIHRRELEAMMETASEELRRAVQEAWYRIHSNRREKFGAVIDPIALTRLSRHDTENYVGVIQQRKQEKPSGYGYSAWWLTLDRSAFTIAEKVRPELNERPPDSPIMSIDFLAQYLTFGPVRGRLSKEALRKLPPMIEPRLVQFLTPQLLAEATRIRDEMKALPELVVRRRIRDRLDQGRRKTGPIAQKGLDIVLDEFRQ